MQRAVEETQQQQNKPKNPMRCPRCNSPSTRFRYFNNNSPTQPRYHCRSCKRQWTVGGRLRLVPIGGNTRSGKRKASSSGGGSAKSQAPQPPLPSEEQHRQNLPLMNPMASQNFDTALFQPMTDMLAGVSPSNYFSDQISCSQTLIQQGSNQYDNGRNLFSSADTTMTIPQEWNVQTIAPQHDLPQKNPIAFESYQTRNEVINGHSPHLCIDSVVQPVWPVKSLAQDITHDSSFTTSNASSQKNLSGDTIDIEDTNVNVDEWLNFPGSDPP